MAVNWKLGETLVRKAAAKTVERLTKVLTKRITELTPIGKPSTWKTKAPPGYTPGLLKASWTSSYSESWNMGIISNPQPYAYRVEFGWSKQAPKGMVRIALREVGDMLKKAAKENMI